MEQKVQGFEEFRVWELRAATPGEVGMKKGLPYGTEGSGV